MTTKIWWQLLTQSLWRPTFKKGDRVRRVSDGAVFVVDVMTIYGPQLVDQHGTFPTGDFVRID